MRHRDFAAFILPSALAMILFIALPIVSVAVQSLFVEHEQVLISVENCGPFGCLTETKVDADATAALKAAEPLGRFNGFGTYLNRAHLAVTELSEILSDNDGLGDVVSRIYNLPFYKALSFTLVYTFLVTPLSMILGFAVALGVNTIPRFFRGPVIFLSLLPYIVTPLLGSLILFWMINSDGVIGASLQWLFDDPELSLKASPALTWVTLIVYGTWHMIPFAFVVFYAGLQTLPKDTLESAMIDGANRWERIRYVVMPHLTPLATFVGLVLLMDNFRVFEPIIGFSSEANATSLSWSIYNDLSGQSDQLFGSAAATSILTMVGVIVLLMPVLIRTWRDFNRKAR
ncbi:MULTISPECIES: carbohydrate ABC transporter permease [unclassified Salipiger]|uniref:carbohydrate ABC transporter permease n=1 Tax=unclassified Salipiger TaxID=2640570 RepID=UPI0013B8530A|nr:MULTISPECIES: sugar ABC transporter permease [unclassified Salipiger]NDV49858.1 sugar ABC transporter permease [Salipiger sp. PrR003]NDW32497.1 sugar ABC transporter permease [Salipiger sp. PrR007]